MTDTPDTPLVALKAWDFKPHLGAATREPSLRSIVLNYYAPHFPDAEAQRLTDAYIAAWNQRTDLDAAGVREAWHRLDVELGEIEGGMHADLEDAASAMGDAVAAATSAPVTDHSGIMEAEPFNAERDRVGAPLSPSADPAGEEPTPAADEQRAEVLERLHGDEADPYTFYGDDDGTGMVVTQHRFYAWGGDCIIAIGERNARNEWDDAAFDARCAALEAALATSPRAGDDRLREAARAAHDVLIELNPNNYSHDDVVEANNAAVEAILLLADVLGETHGKTREWWEARRAALRSVDAEAGDAR